jgi:DNA-binding SARP family transcriptional activator/tetratricopeptide (TPR) repeat protein/DNA-binding XRE family transcriptional regulator
MPVFQVGEVVRRHRLAAGLTQHELAERAGISVRALRDLEHGRIRQPRGKSVRRLAEALALSPAERETLLAAATTATDAERRQLHIGVLGPLLVSNGGAPVAIGSQRQRALLGLLALHSGQVVPISEIIDVLWGESPARTARNLVQMYVSQLRGLLGTAGRSLLSAQGGYALDLADQQLDLAQFDDLVRRAQAAHAANRPDQAVELYARALERWRGRVLADAGQRLRQHPIVAAASNRRIAATVAFTDVAVAIGEGQQVIAALRTLSHEEPLHEAVHGRLMLALAATGEPAAALRVFAELRTRLAEELGVEPGAEVQATHLLILRGQVPDADRATMRSENPTPAPVPAQLPAAPRHFTGRHGQLDMLDTLLTSRDRDATAVFVIEGTAGVGKTALAVHWAHRARDRFPDGQLFADLKGYAPDAPVRPEEALAWFLRGLGVPADQIPADREAASATYRSLLADRRVLVLLDNAATPEQVRPLLPAGPGCLVLVTGRGRLGGLVAREGARGLAVDALPPDEAHALIATVVGAQRAEAEPQGVGELARLCGYLPLALRIAAANLIGQPLQTIAGYAGKLRQRNRVAELSVDHDEQAGVRAAFDQSYATLAGPTRQMFRLVGLVPGSDLTAPAAAALAGLRAAAAERALDQLATAHLLQEHRPGRYGCHDLLKLYAVLRAEEEDDETVRRAAVGRLLDWYLDSVLAAIRLLYPERRTAPPAAGSALGFADRRAALSWLDGERANLVSAARYAAEHGPWPVAWQLADALQRYFWNRGHAVDWLTVAGVALSAAQAAGDPPAQAVAQLNLGALSSRQGRLAPAMEYYQATLDLARQLGNTDLEATALGSLGAVYRQAGRPKDAVAPLTRALRLNRQAGREEPNNVGRLGSVHWELGRLREAADHHARAYAIYEALGAQGGQAIALANLGETHYLLGRPDRARDHFDRALAQYREVGNRDGEIQALCGLARIHSDAGQHPEALALARTALRQARELNGPRTTAEALNVLGEVEQNRRRSDLAAVMYRQGLDLARDSGHPYPQAEALLGLASADLRLGRLDQALDLARQALAITDRAGYQILECRTRQALAGILRALGRSAPAAAEARLAQNIRRRTGYRPPLAAANDLVLSR